MKLCCKCGVRNNLEKDHVLPQSRYPQFKDSWWNIQYLCSYHNKQKGAKIAWYGYRKPFWILVNWISDMARSIGLIVIGILIGFNYDLFLYYINTYLPEIVEILGGLI